MKKCARLRNVTASQRALQRPADGYPATPEDLAFFHAVIFNENMSRQAFTGLTGQRHSSRWGVVKTQRHLETANREALLGYLEMWTNDDIRENGYAKISHRT